MQIQLHGMTCPRPTGGMSGKPRKRRLPRLQGPIANGAIRGTCYVHKPLVYGRTQWTVRMEGVDRVPAAFKRRRTYAGFLADKHAQAAAAAGPEGGRRSEGGSNGDGVGHGEDGEDGKGASAAFLANKRGQAAAAVPEEGRPSEGGGNADGGGNSAAAEDGKDGKQELTAAQEPQGDAGAPDEHDGDGKPRPAAMQEPQSTTPEEDFWAQHGQRYAWLVRAIRSSWPAPKGGRRGLVSQLSGDFMFSFLSLAHARLKTCPGCCPDEHAGAPRYQRQPGSPDTVIYSAVEGRIVANLPAYCCDKCGAKSIVYPVTAGAPPKLIYSHFAHLNTPNPYILILNQSA